MFKRINYVEIVTDELDRITISEAVAAPTQKRLTRRLMTDWSSFLASANLLRKGQGFVRPFRKDAGRDFCGRSNGVLQVSGTKPCAQFKALIAKTEHGHRLGAELNGCQFKGCFVGHDPFPFAGGPVVGLIGRGWLRVTEYEWSPSRGGTLPQCLAV
jgi:hypothetical protein